MAGKGKNGKKVNGSVTAVTNDATVTLNVNENLQTNQGEYFEKSIPELGALLADPNTNEYQRERILKALVDKQTAKEKTDAEKAWDYINKAKQEIIVQASNWVSRHGKKVCEIKPLIALTSEGKPKESATVFSVVNDFRVSELIARRITLTVEVTDRIPTKAQRKLLKDAAFRISQRKLEQERQAEINRLWNQQIEEGSLPAQVGVTGN